MIYIHYILFHTIPGTSCNMSYAIEIYTVLTVCQWEFQLPQFVNYSFVVMKL